MTSSVAMTDARLRHDSVTCRRNAFAQSGFDVHLTHLVMPSSGEPKPPRFLAWLRLNLAAFDPNHGAPLGVEPPVVTWLMSTLDLNA